MDKSSGSSSGPPSAPGTPGPPGTPDPSKKLENINPTVVKCKMVVVGDCACGKTSLIKRYTTGRFVEDYTTTGFDAYTSNYEVTDTFTIQISLWDTSGKGEYDMVRPISYKDADIILLCYSIADPESFRNASVRWYPEIKQYCPDQPIILVACQRDLREPKDKEGTSKKKDTATAEVAEAAGGAEAEATTNSTTISYDQGIKAAKAIDASVYTEVSSKTSRKSVKDMIELAAMSTANGKSNRKTMSFKRIRRSSSRRRRLSDIGDPRNLLRGEAAKGCSIM